MVADVVFAATLAVGSPFDAVQKSFGLDAKGGDETEDHRDPHVRSIGQEALEELRRHVRALGKLLDRPPLLQAKRFDPRHEHLTDISRFVRHRPCPSSGRSSTLPRGKPVDLGISEKQTVLTAVGFCPWNCLSAHDTPPDVTPEEEAKRVKKILGRRISKLRRKFGLAQDDLAFLAGIDRSHMSSIETGKTEPGVWTLARIAGVLETTSSQLLRGLKSSPQKTASAHVAETKK